MARKAFFSFNFEDASRAMVVRNSWMANGNEPTGFMDAIDFEGLEHEGDAAVMDWIDNQLTGTSVTVVLLSAETCASQWVTYGIQRSKDLGHGPLGIDISRIKDFNGDTSGKWFKIPTGYPFYQWNKDDGHHNLDDWIEAAAKDADRQGFENGSGGTTD
jgi:hypothetical protein